MPDDPAPNDTPTPPQGVPAQPYYPPPQPWPYQQQPEGHPAVHGQPPSYLDTPAPLAPVVSRTDAEKPPADFDG